jgi:hypothetical protein
MSSTGVTVGSSLPRRKQGFESPRERQHGGIRIYRAVRQHLTELVAMLEDENADIPRIAREVLAAM